MSWATMAIVRLQQGHTVIVRPRGHSMLPLIRSGTAVTVEPLGTAVPQVDDIVLCRVHGRDYLHRVVAVGPRGYLIGNARGRINGWVPRRAIYGRAVRNSLRRNDQHEDYR